MSLDQFVTARPLVLGLAILGIITANVYLLLSIRSSKAPGSRSVEQASKTRLRPNTLTRLVWVNFIISILAVGAIVTLYFLHLW